MARDKGYGQFCPVARAAEILAERWTPLVVRELLCGSARFNDLQRGVPRMSPTLLSRRLKALEPPDLFLHNHARETYAELDPDLPVNPNCASCLDAEGWMAMVASAEARFQSMLTEQ